MFQTWAKNSGCLDITLRDWPVVKHYSVLSTYVSTNTCHEQGVVFQLIKLEFKPYEPKRRSYWHIGDRISKSTNVQQLQRWWTNGNPYTRCTTLPCDAAQTGWLDRKYASRFFGESQIWCHKGASKAADQGNNRKRAPRCSPGCRQSCPMPRCTRYCNRATQRVLSWLTMN